MAEATLNDVITRLRTDNEKQLREQQDTTVAVEELSGTIRALLEQMEAQRLRDKESDFEARRRVTAPSATGAAVSTSNSESVFNILGPGSILGTLAGVAANLGGAAVALAAATEGFGPSLKTLGRFTTGLAKLQKALIRIPVYPFEKLLGVSLFDDITKNFSKMEKVLKGRYTFNTSTMRWRNLLTGKFAPFDEVERAAKEANSLLSRISNIFKSIRIPGLKVFDDIVLKIKSIKVPDSILKAFDDIILKIQSIKVPDSILKAFDDFKNNSFIKFLGDSAKSFTGLFTKVSNSLKTITIPESVIKSWDNTTKLFTAEGAIGKAFSALGNNRWVTGIVKFLRPLAVILSAFDGLRTASAEMEERESFFSKYIGGGAGGFIGGFIGSFIGEMANLIKDIPLWLISWVVPDDWITTNPDGTWKFNESKNIVTKLLSGIQNLDFNEMLKKLVMIPFNAIGNVLDTIGQYFGLSGTEEQQASTQKMFDEWWNNWFSLKGAGENTLGILGWIVNTVMSPINSVLDSVMEAFGVGAEGGETTFLQKISDFVSWIYGLIPSVDDIKRNLASSVNPNVAWALGLSDYLPQTQEEYDQRSQELLKIVKDESSKIAELEAQLAAAENSNGALSGLTVARTKGALIAAQEERDEANRALTALQDSARASGGINQSTVNNVQSQMDTIFMPNSGSIDNDDIRR